MTPRTPEDLEVVLLEPGKYPEGIYVGYYVYPEYTGSEQARSERDARAALANYRTSKKLPMLHAPFIGTYKCWAVVNKKHPATNEWGDVHP